VELRRRVRLPRLHARIAAGSARARPLHRADGRRYQFVLVRQEPQGINPQDLLLHLVVEEPTTGDDVVTTYEVQYVEHTEMRYDTVSQ
jgi:hypothetical protein